MTAFLPFAIALGSYTALIAVVAAWIYRTTGAPLIYKIAIPVLALVAALAMPFQVLDMMGRPVFVSRSALPEEIALIAFRETEPPGRVDLWIAEDAGPRAYEIPLDDQTREALRDSQQAISEGRLAYLKRAGEPKNGVGAMAQRVTNIAGDDDPGYRLEVESNLPPKE